MREEQTLNYWKEKIRGRDKIIHYTLILKLGIMGFTFDKNGRKR